MTHLLYKKEAYAIVGAAMEVHNHLGGGFLEAVYQEALGLELAARRIPYEAQPRLNIYYKEHKLDQYYIADFVAYEAIIIEIKAIVQIGSMEMAQTLNYLKATGFELGLVINFGKQDGLEWRRVIRTPNANTIGPVTDNHS